MNVAKVGKAACKSRTVSNALTARHGRATKGCQGEDERMCVWSINPKGACCLSPVGLGESTGCARNEHVTALSRNGRSSAQPGMELATYSTKGRSNEQGNFDSDAWPAKPGKPPSPAMFRTKGGAPVVVRARESRAHGEGEQ